MTDIAKTKARFLDRMSAICLSEGMPPIAGRVFGLLLFDGGTLSFSELAEQLDVSRASISTSARFLEDRGLLRRVSRPGHRGDFFELPENPYRGLLAGQLDRNRAALTAINDTIGDLDGANLPDVTRRLHEFEAFYLALQDLTNGAISRLDGDTQ